MSHLEFECLDKRYSLVGNCITVFTTNGEKLAHKFFDNYETAKRAFLELYDITI